MNGVGVEVGARVSVDVGDGVGLPASNSSRVAMV